MKAFLHTLITWHLNVRTIYIAHSYVISHWFDWIFVSKFIRLWYVKLYGLSKKERNCANTFDFSFLFNESTTKLPTFFHQTKIGEKKCINAIIKTEWLNYVDLNFWDIDNTIRFAFVFISFVFYLFANWLFYWL